jgi:hypothetical protein
VRLLTQDLEREHQRQALLAHRSALLQGQEILRDLRQKRYGDETIDDQEPFRMPTPMSEGIDEV